MSQLLQLPFKAGIDEGTDPKQLPPGTLKVGENCRQDKLGRIRKRFGVRELGVGDGTIYSFLASRMLRVGSALAASDGTDSAIYVGGTAADWERIDRVSSLASTVHPLADTTRTTTQATCVTVGTRRISVYSTGLTGFSAPANGALYVQIDDIERGVVLMRPTLLDASASQPRVFNPGTGVVYIAYVTAAGNLTAVPLNYGFQNLGSVVTLATGVGVWDGVLDTSSPSSTVLFFAYTTAAGVFVERGSIATGVVTHTAHVAGAAAYTSIALDVGASVVTVVFADSSPSTSMTTLAIADLATIAAASGILLAEAVAIGVKDLGTGNALVAVTTVDPTLFHLKTASYVIDQTSLAVFGSSGSEISYHVTIASRIFALAGRYYAMATVAVIPPDVATSNSTFVSPQSAIVIEFQPTVDSSTVEPPHRRVATLESRTSALQLYVVTQAPADTAGRVHLAVARKQREPVGTEPVPVSAVVHVIEDRGEDWGASLEVGNASLCVASAPFLLDGGAAYPLGFMHEPDILQKSAGLAGSGSMGAGDYVYCCVYEWRDARGVLHRSAPSAIVTVTGIVATGSVTLRIAQTCVDAKQSVNTGFGASSASPVRIAIYRSIAGGSVLYRLTHEPSYNFQSNDPFSASVLFVDTRADSSITGGSSPAIRLDSRPELYTGQELEAINPGASTTGTVHRNRAWLLAADRRTLQASKRLDEDVEIAPEFNEVLTLTFGSPKHALKSLDDKLVALGDDGIEIVVGDGPASNGDQNDWLVQRVHSDVGCTDPGSVVVVPPGILFRSRRGFELLDRGLALTYIGTPVEDTLAAYPNVTSAVLVAEHQEVRFTCVNDARSAGVVLVFSYAFRAWYVRKYWNGADAFSAAFIDAALVGGTYYLLRSDGLVFKEVGDIFYDSPSSGGAKYVEMKASVPVYPVGSGGWHRLRSVQVIGESKDHHKLTIEASRDFVEAFEQQKVFADGSLTTTPGPLEQARMTLKHQKRQAAVITIYDSAPETASFTTGEGPILTGLDIYYEPKEGPAKLAAGKKG